MLETRVKTTIVQLKTKLQALWQKRNQLDGNAGKALILLGCVSLGMIVGTVQTGIPTKGEEADLDSGYTMALAKAILTFPNEYYYGLGFNKKIMAPIIQAYAAHTLSLQQYYIDSVAQNKANLEILYGLDGVVSLSIDSVPNITRSPLIFEYIYKNFEMKTRDLFGKGYMLLKARPERQDMISSTVTFGAVKSDSNLYIYRFNDPARCSMIRLTPKIEYPITSLIGRPNNFLVEFWSNGMRFQKTGMVTIEPGKPFSTHISLVDPTKFDSYFTNEVMQTKLVHPGTTHPTPGH